MRATTAIYTKIKPNSIVSELPILLAFNLLLVACSYLAINIPFSPVPITGQTFGILLIAMTLGRVRGVGVVLAYLLEGAVGLPVFAGGAAGFVKFVGPTGGYLIGFLIAAYLVGWMADNGWDRSYLKSVIAMTIGTAVIFVFGLIWLAKFIPSEALLTAGLVPFVPGALIKIALASVILPTTWKLAKDKQ
jgi:biotin transport system substrate-specific component